MKQSTSWQLKSSKATVSFPRCRSDPKMAATCSSTGRNMKGIGKYLGVLDWPDLSDKKQMSNDVSPPPATGLLENPRGQWRFVAGKVVYKWWVVAGKILELNLLNDELPWISKGPSFSSTNASTNGGRLPRVCLP